MDTFNPGDTIDGKYEITKILGKGGMGLVLEARRPGLGKPVALKVLLPELRDKPDIAGRFAREARAGDTLRSEHVARVLDVGTTAGGTPFIVMEHLTGQDLAGVIGERGQLPVADAADLLLQACEAIAEAHTHGIIHRDLKPGNLFVTTSVDGLPFVKVLDFGIAKTKFPDDTALTESGAFFGSPRYMSPEQLGSPKDVDARSDVWALGVILYEMLAGVPPFTGDTFPVLCAAILGGSYSKVSALRTGSTGIPSEVDAIISDALASKLESRIPSVDAFARRLAPFGTSGARQSYARIERLSGGAAQPEVANLQATAAPLAAPLAEPTGGLGLPQAGRDGPVSKADAPSPAKRPRSAMIPRLMAGLVGLTVVGGLLGFRQMHSGSPTTASSSPPVAEVASSPPVAEVVPAASAIVAPPPAATAEPPAAATSAFAAADRAVLAEPAAAPGIPSVKTGSECAKGATPACEAACAAHAPGRCEALAKALVKGNSGTKDVARAEKLYQAECDGGAGSACNALGVLYGSGTDVPQDNAKAVSLYKRGCEREDRTACMNLGGMHFDGTGVPKNQSLGVTYFVRACPSTGPVEPFACLNLSIAYSQGLGVPKDASQALSYAKQACDKGAPRGCTRASMAKLAGEGVPKDVQGGLGELDGMCARGEPSACAQLIGLFSRGLGADVPSDPARVRVYAEKGCKAHDAQSCQVKAALEAQDSSGTTVAQSNAQLETSCNAGVLRDCGFLGERVLAGQGMTADRSRGLALLDRACKGGAARACQKLAEAGAR